MIDPAGGSCFVEVITGKLAGRAWALFQEVEKIGGMAAALQAGVPQKAVAATAKEKITAVGRRRDSIVGVNQYANTKEKTLDVPVTDTAAFQKQRAAQVASHRTSLGDSENEAVLGKLAELLHLKDAALFAACIEAVGVGATLGEVTRAIRGGDTAVTTITPVCLSRAAVQFESLRGASDRYLAKHKVRPAVFLCNMGSLREHKARADFSRGFFAAGCY